MTTRRNSLKTLARAGAALLAGLAVALASAETFPGRPVKIITPFPAGSGPDAALRLVAEQLQRKWGQPVVIENKPGGNGFIAAAAFKQGSGDGYDLIQLDNSHVTSHPHFFSKLPYDVERDFAPLRMILRTYFFVAVGKDSPFHGVDDIVSAAKAKPSQVSYGSWFNGSPGHVGALRLQAMAGVQMVHVPYRDFGQLYAAVANNEVHWALGSSGSAGAMERAGKLRFMAMAGPRREPSYPSVPSTAESSSTSGYEVSGWTGLFAPRGIAPALRDKIAADIADALAAPEVVERYKVLGFEAPELATAAFAELIQRETRTWGDVIKAANLKLD